MKITSTHRFSLPPERVFEGASSIESFGEWMPGFVSVERLNDKSGVGAAWRETRRMFGKEAVEYFEVTAWEPPTGFELYVDGRKGSTGKGEFRFRYEFTPDRAGTVMTMHGEISGMGFAGKVFSKPLGAMFRKAIDKDHAALAAWLESRE